MGVESSCVPPEDSCEYTIYVVHMYVRTCDLMLPCPGGVCVLRLGWHKSKLCSIALAVLYVSYMPCLLCVVLAV